MSKNSPASTKKSLVSKATDAIKKAITPKPITIRYSTNHETWVEVDSKNFDKVVRELPTPCYLTNVSFDVHNIYESSGCGSSITGKAGVATGTLRSSLPRGLPKIGYDNLGFGKNGFTSSGEILTKARLLFLENSRFAKVLV
jgi:hypothetical protein